MNYERHVLGDPNCRDYVEEAFFGALDTTYSNPKLRSAFQGLELAACSVSISPFFEGGDNRMPDFSPRKKAFLLVAGLGFAVGCLDDTLGQALELPDVPPVRVRQVPDGVMERGRLWVAGGPIVTTLVPDLLNPLGKDSVEFVMDRDFFDGYCAGVGYSKSFHP